MGILLCMQNLILFNGIIKNNLKITSQLTTMLVESHIYEHFDFISISYTLEASNLKVYALGINKLYTWAAISYLSIYKPISYPLCVCRLIPLQIAYPKPASILQTTPKLDTYDLCVITQGPVFDVHKRKPPICDCVIRPKIGSISSIRFNQPVRPSGTRQALTNT